MEQISEREKAALTYCYFHGLNYATAYKLIHNKKDNEILQSSVSRWLHYNKIQSYLQELEKVYNLRMYSVKKKGNENAGKNRDGNIFTGDVVNFTEISQFIAYLNNKANTITDENQRQKYLSMLSDLLRFKETGNSQSGDIQRFYIPVTCNNCQLYRNKQNNKPTL